MDYNYKCYTAQGCWGFEAPTDLDAMRLGLFYAWRDGEDFLYIERVGKNYTLSITLIEHNHYNKPINFHQL